MFHPSRQGPCVVEVAVTLSLLILCIPTASQAQDERGRFRHQERETRKQLETERAKKLSRKFNEQLSYKYGGWTQLSYFAINNQSSFSGIPANDRYLRQIDNRWWIDLEYDDTHRVYWREQLRHRDYSPGDQPFDGENQTEFEVDQLFYQMDVDEFLLNTFDKKVDYELDVTLGRQPLSIGEGLVYSRQHDGIQLELASEIADFKTFYARSDNDEIDIDLSRPNFDKTRRLFWGNQLTINLFSQVRPYVFHMTQRDHNRENPEGPTNFNYDSTYTGVGIKAEPVKHLSVGSEYIKSYGNSLSAPPQTVENIDSEAFLLRLEYFLNQPWIPRFQFDYMYGSGDPDRANPSNTFGGNTTGTDDESFVGFGYINTGRVLNPDLSNIHIFRGGVNIQPFKTPYKEFEHPYENLQIGLDLFSYQKDRNTGGISDANANLNRSDLGWEADLYANWRVYSDTIMQFRYGYFLPGDAYGSRDNRSYLGLHMTFVY